jgi:C-terminal domain of 1-Cys peroxiredoxin
MICRQGTTSRSSVLAYRESIRIFSRCLVDGPDAMWCGKDKHGELCPANWKEGGKVIQADLTAKREYFAAVDRAQENGKVNGIKRACVS